MPWRSAAEWTTAPERTTAAGDGVLSIDFALPNVTPQVPAADVQSGSMYRFFRAAAEGLVEWTEAVRRFRRR